MRKNGHASFSQITADVPGRKNVHYRATSAVIWEKLACPSERVERERH